MQYSQTYNENVITFANNIHTQEGGMHLTGFKSALTRSLNNYARNKGFLKEKDLNMTNEDVREGLTAVISVKLADPQFEGQTKSKLGNPEVRSAVETVFNEMNIPEIGGGNLLKVFPVPAVRNQPYGVTPFFEDLEILQRKERLATKMGRGVLGNNEYLEVRFG